MAIFQLVIAIIASKRYQHSSATLMLVAGVIQLGNTLCYPLVNFFNLHSLSGIYSTLNVIGFIGNVIFIVSLFQLVSYLSDVQPRRDDLLNKL